MGGRDGRKRNWQGGSKGGKGGKGGKGKKGKGGSKGKGGGKAGGGSEKRRRTGSGPLPERAVVISSASPSFCTKATREAVRLLNDALEELRPPQAADTGGDGAPSVDDPAKAAPAASMDSLLDAELSALRGGPSAEEPGGESASRRRPPRIAFYSEVTRGIAVIRCPGPSAGSAGGQAEGDAGKEAREAPYPPPSALVERVFASHRAGASAAGRRIARFVVRMLPLDFVCSPHLKQFQNAAAAAIPKALAGAPPDATWYLNFQNRAMSTIKREDALAVLKDIIRPLNMELSVCDADYMIIVEVNPALCGFSVLRGYSTDLFECNLQALCASEGLQADDESSDEDEDEDEDEDDDAGEAECSGAGDGAERA